MGINVINTQKSGEKFNPFWKTCVGAGRACEGLRIEWQKQLEMAVNSGGFRYLRFHGLLCDDMGVYHKVGEHEYYNYTYVDMLFDKLLETGIRPFVEFGFMPSDLASGTKTQFWWQGNITPPNDYTAWSRLLTNLVSHWIARYGEAEVMHWYFEIWNEADLNAFWSGTKSEYFKLYEYSAKAIKSINPKLRVGGPATSNFVPDERFHGEVEDFSKHKTHLVEDLQSLAWQGVWLKDFLTFCDSKNLPLDFISTHPYPTDFALDGQEKPNAQVKMKGRSRYVYSLRDDLRWLNALLAESKYPNAEVHLTEWSSSPTSRDYSHDYLPAATYVVKCNLDCIGLTDSLSYWVFTDIFEEAGPGPEAFHGGFGLLTMHGIKKPTFHAYQFLNRLGEYELQRSDKYFITKNSDRKVQGIFYHYPEALQSAVPISEYPNHTVAEEIQTTGTPVNVQLLLTDFVPGTKFRLETLDEAHGNATTLWKQMNYPSNLTKEQEQQLKYYAENLKIEHLTANEYGQLSLELTLAPWSILFLEEI